MRDGLSHADAGRMGGFASSNTLKSMKIQRIQNYNNNPKLCKQCNSPIEYDKRRNDFCSKNCSATFNNQGVRRHGEAPSACLFCGKLSNNDKFCSTRCQKDHEWKLKKEEMLSTGIDSSTDNRLGKKYLIELHEGQCQICNLSEWCGKPMPLVLDHISGNPYDNHLTNLRVICHNCNAQTPTFAGRNKGNGRVARAKRYLVERKLFKEAGLV